MGDNNPNPAADPSHPGPSTSSSSSATTTTPNPNQPSSSQQQPTQPQNLGYKGDMKEYCKNLESWLWTCYWQRECAVSAYFTALSSFYPPPPGYQTAQQQQSQNHQQNNNNNQMPAAASNNNLEGAPNLNHQQPRQILLRGLRREGNRVTFDFKIAPLWKRVLAEIVDFFILLIVKIFVTISIVDNFDLVDLDTLDFDALQESGTLMDVAYSLTSELILLEITHRFVVCFFEAYCLAKGGATPGKSLFGLRVLHCEQVFPVGDQINNNVLNIVQNGTQILVSPGSFLSFPRALARSALKNFTLAFFFPACFSVFHFEHYRSFYDVLAKSIVVQVERVGGN